MSSVLVIKDIFEELSEENQRLLNELIFANKCLNIFIEFKTIVNSMFNTFKDNFSSIDSQKYEELNEKLNEVVTELNDKRRIDFDYNVKQEVNLCNGYEEDNGLNSSEDSIGSDDKQTLKSQQKRPKAVKRLRCKSPDCEFSANSVEEMQEHWNKKYNCHYSNCRFRTNKLSNINRHLSVHVKRDDNSDTISAVIEDIIARDDSPSDDSHSDSGEDRTEEEVNVTKKSGPHECQYCGKIALRYCGMITHINTCHPEHAIKIDRRRRRYACDLDTCKMKFPSLSLMFDHQKSEHTIDKPFVCTQPDCHYESLDPKDFHSHRMTHRLNRTFVCTVVGCDKQFYRKDRMWKHMNVVHREKRYLCSEGCGKMFKTDANMSSHVESVHMAIKNYPCEWPGCDYASYYRHGTAKHYKTVHTKEKNFVCDLCDKPFVSQCEMLKHKRISHKMGPPLTCSWPGCDYSTHNDFCMRKHTTDHENGPRFACPWPDCDKRVMSKQSLQNHIDAIHKKLKPHLCPEMGCQYRTAFRRCIRQHMRTHKK